MAVILSSFEAQSEPATRVTLFQGIAQRGQNGPDYSEGCGIGEFIKSFQLLPKERLSNWTKKSKEKKAERWSKIAREAAKQCHRAYVPGFAIPEDFDKILRGI